MLKAEVNAWNHLVVYQSNPGIWVWLNHSHIKTVYCAVAGYFRAEVSVKSHLYTRVSRECEAEIDPPVLGEAKKYRIKNQNQ